MMSQVATLKGMAVDLWAPLDLAKIPNSANLKPEFVNKYPDGRVAGIGAVTWYITLVSNTERLSAGAEFLGLPLGPGERRQARAAGARLQLVPAGDHGEDLLRRHRACSTPRRASCR